MDDFLEPSKRDNVRERRRAGMQKKLRDGARLEGFPETSVIKAEVKHAMCKLQAIRDHVISHGYLADMPHQLKVEATTAVVGIIAYNSFAGRSGEWTAMQRQHVVHQYKKNADHLICPQHKTALVYGHLAKFVPPGSWRAFEVYNALPGKTSDLFLDPTSADSAVVSFSSFLKRFGNIHFCMADPPNSNLIRKMFHSVLIRMSREGTAMSLMQKVDAHSADVAKQVYSISSVAADAKLAKMLYEEIMGDPVEWPTSEELGRITCTADSIVQVGSALQGLTWDVAEDADEPEEVFQLIPLADGYGFSGSPEYTQRGCEAIVVFEEVAETADEPETQLSAESAAFVAAHPSQNADTILQQGLASGELPVGTSHHTIATYLASVGRHLLTHTEKAFIEANVPHGSAGDVIYPGKASLEGIINDGQRSGDLSKAVTFDAVKSHIRKLIKKSGKQPDKNAGKQSDKKVGKHTKKKKSAVADLD